MFDALDGTTPVLIQGMTGRMGRFHTALMREYGTNIVAGVSYRASSETEVDGLPVYASCVEAAKAHAITATVVMVPPLQVRAAVDDALAAGIKLIITIAEGVPVHDALVMAERVRRAGSTWIGASTPGLCSPGKIKLGFLPNIALGEGPLAVMSKSGTLSYEVCYRLLQAGVGQSAWVGVGGDAVKGLRFADLAGPLSAMKNTRGLLLIGEVGGDEEEAFAARLASLGLNIPVFALIAGREAKEGVSMGHAGAMVLGDKGSLASKKQALEDAGAQVYDTIAPLVVAVSRQMRSYTAPLSV